jgi:hypothetical protein
MKRVVLALAAMLVATAAIPAGSGPAPESTQVHARGCVEAGALERCLMVRDEKSRKLYNILTKEPHPAVGDAIEFTGTPHEGEDNCMQGIAVDVTNWERKHFMKCSKGDSQSK